jgi:hypothetical protein
VLVVLLCALSIGNAPLALGQEADPPEDETLLRGVQSSGGYGAPTVALTSVHGEWAVLTGGQGGWIINRQFVLGGAGRGLATLPSTSVRGREREIQMGYGGLLLEYIGAPSELIHYGLSAVVGGGSVQLVRDGYDHRDDEAFDQSALFVTEAGGRLELNVTSFFRIGAGGGYLFVSGSDVPTVSDADLRGPYGQLSLRFGSF